MFFCCSFTSILVLDAKKCLKIATAVRYERAQHMTLPHNQVFSYFAHVDECKIAKLFYLSAKAALCMCRMRRKNAVDRDDKMKFMSSIYEIRRLRSSARMSSSEFLFAWIFDDVSSVHEICCFCFFSFEKFTGSNFYRPAGSESGDNFNCYCVAHLLICIFEC